MRVRTDEDSRWYQFFTFFFSLLSLFFSERENLQLVSTLTRSTGGALAQKPVCECAPWMDLIDDLKSEKVSRHLSQAITELYELSHFEVRSDASLL